jgi:hypothetical protein
MNKSIRLAEIFLQRRITRRKLIAECMNQKSIASIKITVRTIERQVYHFELKQYSL